MLLADFGKHSNFTKSQLLWDSLQYTNDWSRSNKAAIIMTIGELLTNRTVERFTIGDHGVCSLTISGGYSLSQGSLLRYVGRPGVFISSMDHKHQFGLPAPYDAEQDIHSRIIGQTIRRVEITPGTGDLALCFDDGRIEIICTSAGYEAYQVYGPDNFIMVGRGGCEEKP